MAKISILDFIDIGTGGPHDATTWKVFKDEQKTILLDKSEYDTVNLTIWHTPLPKEDVIGEFYNDLREFWVEVQIHANGHTSDPKTVGPFNQLFEEIDITDGDKVEKTTSKKLEWYEE